jgi:hypothetical protein
MAELCRYRMLQLVSHGNPPRAACEAGAIRP